MVKLASSSAGRRAISEGVGLNIVRRLAGQLCADSSLAAAKVLRELSLDARCEGAFVHDGGIPILVGMLQQAPQNSTTHSSVENPP